MKNQDPCAEAFKVQTEAFLDSEPDYLASFREKWGKEEFRNAYRVWDMFTRKHGTILTPDQEKKDKDFYWSYIA